jgi:hypothetical protein
MLAPSLLDEAYLTASSLLAGGGKGMDKDVTVPMAIYRSYPYTISPTCPLSVYTTPLQHLGDCLIYLCIDDVARFESHELISLTTIPRLAVLELLERNPARSVVTDRLIRGWSEAGEPRQAFPSLRVLRISSSSHAVSEDSLQYALMFPALEIFDTTVLPKERWRRASEIAHNHGWKVTKPKGSLFVSYAQAYLDGLLEVNTRYFESLRGVITNDRQRVILQDDPRRLIYEEWKRRQVHDRPGKEPDGPDLSSYLDDGWRAFLQGTYPLFATTDPHKGARDMYDDRPTLTMDQAFLFLALLAQSKYDPGCGIRAQAEGLTLPREPFASLQLRSSFVPEGQHLRALDSDRLIFSRRRVGTEEETSERSAAPRPPSHTDPPPSWAPRQDDRKVTDFKARKRQRTTADLLSSFGTSSGTSG